VVLMGADARAARAPPFLARGWAGATRATILLAAATAESHTWRGTLSELGTARLPETDRPGLLVIGDVVRVSAQLEEMLSNQSQPQRATGV